MRENELPLFDLFLGMRDLVKPRLDIDHYHQLLCALEAGFITDTKDLQEICRFLWLKSHQPEKVEKFKDNLTNCLDSLKLNYQSLEAGKKSPKQSKSGQPNEPAKLSVNSPDSAPSKSSSSPRLPSQTLPKEIPLAVKTPLVTKERFGSKKFSLTVSDFPVTNRQMQRSWRNLRLAVYYGNSQEVDINATVKKMSEDGFFLEPVHLTKQINRVELLLLIDASNSMNPFHLLIEEIVKTVDVNFSKFQRVQIYYFRNFPSRVVYQHPHRPDSVPIDDVIKSRQKTCVLIVSDAGAVREGMNEKRIKMTQEFVAKLTPDVRRLVWLNPVPQERWRSSSAAKIADLTDVDMFELDAWGVKLAMKAYKK